MKRNGKLCEGPNSFCNADLPRMSRIRRLLGGGLEVGAGIVHVEATTRGKEPFDFSVLNVIIDR